jgi:peroxiredoxin
MELFDIKITGTDGEERSLAEIQGSANLLLIFFRGAWCNHCKKQLFELNNFIERLGELNVKVAAVSSDTRFKSSLLKTFLKLKFPVLSDENFKLIGAMDLKTDYQNKQIAKPSVFLYSAEKKLLFSYIGSEYDDRLSASEIIKQVENEIKPV